MNKKVIFLFILTIIALVILALFSFGPLSNKHTTAGINPSSLKPVHAATASRGNVSIAWNLYRNRDEGRTITVFNCRKNGVSIQAKGPEATS